MSDAANILVAVGGDVSVADVGSTMPLDATAAVDAAFTNVGYIGPDGVSPRLGPGESEAVRVWQSTIAVKYRPNTERVMSVGFSLAEFNAVSIPLAFGGGTIVDIAGDGSQGYRYDPPDSDVINEQAMVIDWAYGGFDYRLAIPRGVVSGDSETQLVWSSESMLPITFNILETAGVKPYALFSTHPGFAPA